MEFNLSEKEIDYKQYPLSTSAFLREDVKEFIRLLKENLPDYLGTIEEENHDISKEICETINKLAGTKLI